MKSLTTDQYREIVKDTKPPKHRAQPEEALRRAVAQYLALAYPTVMFHFERVQNACSKRQMRQIKVEGGAKGWPDLFIAEPRLQTMEGPYGLFLELKAEGTKLWKQNGFPASDHVRGQADALYSLRLRGYKAEFAVGFDEAKAIIDAYLGDAPVDRRG